MKLNYKYTPKILTIVVVVLTLLLTPLAVVVNPQTVHAVENGKIVYMKVYEEGGSDVFSIDPDGSDEAQLTNDGVSAYPSVSPDGTKIAFAVVDEEVDPTEFNLYTMEINGTNKIDTGIDILIDLDTFMSPLNWTRDSQKLYSFDSETQQGFIVNSDGTGKISNGLDIAKGAWFEYSSEGEKVVYHDNDTYQTYIANADGSSPSKLNTVAGSLNPTFSPDDNTVYFIGSSDLENLFLYSVSADGTNETQLLQVSGLLFSISPDGNKAAVSGGEYGDSFFVINTDGSGSPAEIGHIVDDGCGFDWSPDSTRFVSSAYLDDYYDIYTMNVDGTSPTNITNTVDAQECIYFNSQAWAPVPGSLDNEENEDSEAGNSTVLTTNLPATNKKSYLVLPSTVTNASFTTTPVSSVPEDSDGQYSYPTDLVSFQFDTDVGATETITLYYDLPGDPAYYVARKYNETTKQFSSIENATITREDYNNTNMLKLSYQITDGGTLDQDGEVNGTIVDPVGLAQNTELAQTGQSILLYLALGLSLVTTASLLQWRAGKREV
jgi:Tol biopolymer transport system component